MEIPKFLGYGDKDETNPMEWLRLVKQYDMTPSREINYFFRESWKWWMSIDQDTICHCTWEKFEELFSNKWIKDTNMEGMYRIQDELKETKEEIKNKGEEISKI
jgi:hypothetical protein